MTKGQLLEEECKKNKRLADEAAKALSDAQAKSSSSDISQRITADQVTSEKEKHEALVKELKDLKKMCSACKDDKKAQNSSYKRAISECKFEV